ncbi:MAG TPA: TetR/AcrR family transcriptional regulator [Pseudonocardiaceae bacterium]|nr:TetR/AcrR family transcriptional regulator [Pseudonocardiaceae bacterium]
MGAPEPPGSRRPGGRTARNRAAVVEATLAELARHGYPGLTVENVAERSGVHKTTVYRRWGGVDGLIVDALDAAGEDDWPAPVTGSWETDLRAVAYEVVDTFTDPERAAVPSAVVHAAFHSERAATALHGFLAGRHSRAADAIARGALPGSVDAAAVVRSVTAPLYCRLFITGERVNRDVADQAVAAAVAAVRAGVYG